MRSPVAGADPPGDEGWKPDPRRQGDQRYWDGDRWASMRATDSPLSDDPRRRTRRAAVLIGLLVVASTALASIVVLVAAVRGPQFSNTPQAVGATTAVATGRTTSCALESGDVWCWGAFDRSDDRPMTLGLVDVVELAGGGDRYCARDSSAVTLCWSGDEPEPLPDGPDDLDQIAVSASHACGVRDGGVLCWGDAADGQLGAGRSDGVVGPEDPVEVPIGRAVQVAVAPSWTCAVLVDGDVWCWGSGSPDGVEPAPVPGVSDATAVAVAEAHACAVVAEGAVRCWGDDRTGALGDGRVTGGARVGDRVVGLSGVSSISVGPFSSCAVAKAEVTCWGDNAVGQLGDGGRSLPRRQPVAVAMDVPAVQVSVGGLHACAVDRDATVWCWGVSSDGQTGGDRRRSDPTPRTVELGR